MLNLTTKQLANAVYDHWKVTGHDGCGYTEYSCHFCDGYASHELDENAGFNKFKHKSDCPFLLAEKVLNEEL